MSLLDISSLLQQCFILWEIECGFRHKLSKVLVYYIECHIILISIDEVIWFLLLLINIDSVNIYIQIAYIEYQIVIDIYEVLTKACIYQFIVALFSSKDSTWLSLLAISRTICFAGYLWRGKLVIVWLSFSLFKTPGHRGRLPWASPP